ncbi:MAG: D-alanyl-D-alanine carboxypeptidase [Pseudomonadota bacterium]|nr:D-alanyl-D-alanine carboxypeptidase [Pseudomonadota bacterium]
MSMLARSRMLIVVAFFLCTAQAVLAQTPPPLPIPAPPTFDAKSWLMMDFDSSAVLAEHNADGRVEPASITKIMTTYVLYKALRDGQVSLDDDVLISEKAWRMQGSKMFVEVGDRVELRELLKGIIIQSGNDATVAVAEHVAGTEDAFVQLMNAQARRLGMTGTHYADSTGWPQPQQYTTALDTAKLSQALIRDFPEYYKGYSEREFTFNGIKQYNRNTLLWQDESVDGLKTGHTESAGYCLAASAEREDMRLITVVMGAASEKARAANTQALLNYGFRFFETHKLYAAHESLARPRLWKGAVKNVPAGIAQDLYITIPRDRYQALRPSVILDNPILAPVAKRQPLGEVKIGFEGKSLKAVPLIALQSVEKGGLWRQAVDTVLMWFQ